MERMFLGLLLAMSLNVANAHEDAVLEWNRITFDLLLEAPPPIQMRFGAIVQLAVFEAVNSVSGEYRSTVDVPRSAPDASAPAAAVGAAHRVLRTYFPERGSEFDVARDRSLARIPAGPARDAGIAAGEAAAIAVMASRENDGAEKSESYLPGSAEPGQWQLTAACPPTGGVFLHWRDVKPFVIRSAAQFRLPPPPSLGSPRYVRAFEEVLEKGARDSTQRPPDRTLVAQFYETFGDAGLWNPVARQLARAGRHPLTENARIFALMNLALHDLTVALVETKYHYHFWRPETAILASGTSYTPLVPAPCHPSYPSGHAATSGAAREVLERAFGARGHRIVVTQPGMPGVKLEYSTLEEITDDIDDARVYGGIHFRFDQKGGAEQGRNVAAHVWRHAFARADRCHRTRPYTDVH